MPAFAADEFQICHDVDLTASSGVLYPIPDECELKSVQTIGDASPSATSFLLTVLLGTGYRAYSGPTDLKALIAAGGVVYDVPLQAAGNAQKGLPEGSWVYIAITANAVTVVTSVAVLLTFRRMQQDGPLL